MIVAGVCQFQAQDPSQFRSAGVGNSRLHYSQGTISLEYTGGAPCGDGLALRTKIDFVCELNGSERVVSRGKLDGCSHLIIVYTDLACGAQVGLQLSFFPLPLHLTILSSSRLPCRLAQCYGYRVVSTFKSQLRCCGFIHFLCWLAGGVLHPG
jgi:hypothetical protein